MAEFEYHLYCRWAPGSYHRKMMPGAHFANGAAAARIGARLPPLVTPEKETVSNLVTVALLAAMFCAFFGLGFVAGQEVRPAGSSAPRPQIESPAVYGERV